MMYLLWNQFYSVKTDFILCVFVRVQVVREVQNNKRNLAFGAFGFGAVAEGVKKMS
ncbi:hypothetical protein GCM10028791_37950 [Echinicola sediminis]